METESISEGMELAWTSYRPFPHIFALGPKNITPQRRVCQRVSTRNPLSGLPLEAALLPNSVVLVSPILQLADLTRKLQR